MKFLKQFSLYTFVGFLYAGISVLLMPYISQHIDPAGNAILSMVNSIVTIYIQLMGVTAVGLITIEYYNYKNSFDFASFFSSVLLIPIIPGILLLILSLIFAKDISAFLEIPTSKSYWVPIGYGIALLTIYTEVLFSYIIIEQKPTLYAKISIGKFLLEISLTILLISVFKLGWEGRLLSWLITTIAISVLSFWYFSKKRATYN